MNKAFITSFLLVVAISFGQEEQNLIKNGGFENQLIYWTALSEGISKATFTTDTKNKQIGKQALKVDVIDLGRKAWDVQCFQKFPSKKGTNYEISLLAKSNSLLNEFGIFIEKNTKTKKTLTTTKKWKVYSWHTIAKEDSLHLSIQFPNKGVFYIDNIIIKEIPKVKKRVASIKGKRKTKDVHVIKNGGFEQGFREWNNFGRKEGEEVEFKLNTETPYEGKTAMSVDVTKLGTNYWDIQSINKIHVKKNNRYYVSFYSKSKQKNKDIKVQIQNTSGSIYFPYEFITTKTDEWEKHEFEFTAVTNDLFFAFHHVSKGVMEYDNIVIQKIEKKIK